jgi:hypothetical protein
MPLTLSTDALNAMAAGTIAHGWLLELACDEGTLRCWDKENDISYGGHTYEGLADQWQIEGMMKLSSDLVPEPLTFSFDASRILDNSSFVGRLSDRSWHQRPVKLTALLLVPGTNFITPIDPYLEWNGVMDTIETTEKDGSPYSLIMGCEGGIFRALDRNLTTCTHVDQRKRDPTDRLFENVATKPRQDVPFGRSWSNVPGASGRGGTSGGGSSWTSRRSNLK